MFLDAAECLGSDDSPPSKFGSTQSWLELQTDHDVEAAENPEQPTKGVQKTKQRSEEGKPQQQASDIYFHKGAKHVRTSIYSKLQSYKVLEVNYSFNHVELKPVDGQNYEKTYRHRRADPSPDFGGLSFNVSSSFPLFCIQFCPIREL